jgi:hypothetical protein
MKYTSRNPNGINQIASSSVAITVLNNDVAVFTTSSLNLSGSLTASSALITGNVTVLGTASINTLVVNQTQLSTGSNQLGDAANDTQTLYGTVVIPTGSLTVSGSSIMSGSLNVTGGITGSFSGSGTIESASFASTASYVNPLVQNVNITGSLNVTGSGFILNPANQIAGLSIVSPPTAGGSLVLSTIGSPGVNNGAYLILRHADGTFPTPSSTDNVRIISTQDSQYFNGTSYITSTKIVDISEGQKIFGVTPSFGGTLTYYGKLSKGNWYFGDLSSTINTARDTSVNARVQIKGSGTTDATTAFRVENANASGSMVVLDNGFVGIGTTSPTTKLSIIGNEYSLAAETASDINFYTVPGITNHFNFYNIRQNSDYNFKQNVGGVLGTTTLIIKGNSGNVGIGTTTPSASLHISGSSGSVLLEVDSNSQQNILYVSGSGNIGVGTSSPAYKLDVNGVARVGASGSSGQLYIKGFAGVGQYVYLDDGATVWSLVGGSNYHIQENGIARFTVKAGGNVGIGITTPTQITSRLQVKGSGTTSATTSFRVENANASGSMVVLDDGNVGIGTITPSENLHVSGNILIGNYGSSLSLLRFANITNIGNSAYIGRTAAAQFEMNPGSVNDFRIQQPVGTDTATLTMYGNGVNTAQFYRNQRVRFGGNLLTNPSASVEIIGATTSSLSSSLLIQNSSLSPSLIVLDSGNVGIGTTTPSYKLDVSGSGNFTNNLTVTGSFTVTTGSLIEFQVNQTGVKIGNATTDSHAVTGSVSISSSFSTSSAAFNVYKSGSTVLDIQGSQGQLFSVVDSLTGSLMSVNDVSGLPILEVFSDDRVVMGTYGNPALIISGSVANVTGSLVTQGQTIDPALIWFMS